MSTLGHMVVPDAVRRIPPFPPAAVALLHRIPISSSEPYEVRDLLAKDPQWEMEVARAVNNREAPGNLVPAEAISQVDMDELSKSAIVVAGHYYIRDMARLELRRYWRYSLACAIASDELARHGNVNCALAYAGGLLHDIGRLALMSAYPQQYANLVMLTERMFAEGSSFEIADYERMLFGLDRYSIADWLAVEWDLPPAFRSIVTKFHHSSQTDELDLVRAVRFGCRLANALGYGLMLGAPKVRPRLILSQLPHSIQERWTDFAKLPAIIESRLVQYGEPVPATA